MKIFILSILLATSSFMHTNLLATSSYNSNDHTFLDEETQQIYDQLLQQSGGEQLEQMLPEQARDFMSQHSLDSIQVDGLLNLDFIEIFEYIFAQAKASFVQPLSVLLSLLGVVLLSSILESMKSTVNSIATEGVFNIMSVVCACGVVVAPIAVQIKQVVELIQTVSKFILAFIPIYAGVVTASGKPITAVGYHVSLISIVQIISTVCSIVLVPLLTVYLAFCVIGSCSTTIDMSGIAKTIKNIVVIILSFLMTIFIGIISIQGVVASSADSVTIKATKFAITAFLPVVGAAISEALESVQGCITILRNSMGAFGIITVIASFLPSALTLLLYCFAINISSTVAQMLGVNRIASLLSTANSVMSLLFGILLVYFVLLTISIGVVINLSA